MLIYNDLLCTGCRVCEQACFQAHYRGNTDGGSRIKISSRWPDKESVVVCRQCPNPKCLTACLERALTQTDGIIVLGHQQCTRCDQCFDACPFGARVLNEEGYPAFCDTCDGRYECVHLCPTNALKRGGNS